MTPARLSRTGIILIIVAGAAFLFGLGPFAIILLVAGLTLFAYGSLRQVSAVMEPAHAHDEDYAPTEIRLLIQSMAAMAAADGKIADQEATTIATIHEQMLGLTISRGEVDEILSEYDEGFDIHSRLEKARVELSPVMRQIIVKSCYLVMMSDTVEDRRETAKIHEIGRALGYNESQVNDMLAAAST